MKNILEQMIEEAIDEASKKFGEKGIIFTDREKAILDYGLNIGIMIAGKALISSGCEVGKDEPKKEEPTEDTLSSILDEIMPCDTCHGNGFVPIGPGIRGIKKCPVCNGLGRMSGKKDKGE